MSAGPGVLVYLEVRRETLSGPFALTLVTTDGRAFDRSIAVESAATREDLVRLVASHASHLIAGIDAGTVAPDRQDVPLPEPTPPRECSVCPATLPRQGAKLGPASAPVAAPAEPTEPQRRLWLGVDGPVSTALGLGAHPDADRFVGWGGGAALRHASWFECDRCGRCARPRA